MLIIELGFPAGRYHATPWGRNVNEGVTEWPPSPYRLIRALCDVWHRKDGEEDIDGFEGLLAELSSNSPMFRLPPAAVSHTRAYLPLNDKDTTKKALVLDAFVVVKPGDAVLVGWPDVSLSAERKEVLGRLLARLNYLGRSESWVSARLLDDSQPVTWNCAPLVVGDVGFGNDVVRVAAPKTKAMYDTGCTTGVSGGRKGRGRKTAAPTRWLHAIEQGTSDLQKSKWSAPPAMVFIDYCRNERCFEVRNIKRPVRRTPVVEGALYAVDSKVPPSVLSTVSIAEQVRRNLMGAHRRIVGDPAKVSRLFSGKNADGTPLMGAHEHLYYLPLDRNGDGRIDHLLVVGKIPLDATEALALDRLNPCRQYAVGHDIRFVPVKFGTREELVGKSKEVTSVTPFVPTRYWRKGRADFNEWLVSNVKRECSSHGLPEPIVVRPVELLDTGRTRKRWIEFLRSRRKDTPRPGFGFDLVFAEEVPSTFSIGYGAHFGLGIFIGTR